MALGTLTDRYIIKLAIGFLIVLVGVGSTAETNDSHKHKTSSSYFESIKRYLFASPRRIEQPDKAEAADKQQHTKSKTIFLPPLVSSNILAKLIGRMTTL